MLTLALCSSCGLTSNHLFCDERHAEQAGVTWYDDLDHGLRIAREQSRPLFVTLRCLPCKQCADFDKDVLEGGPELEPLLKQFVTVRLTDAAQIDLRILPAEGFQDTDLSWWGYFLSDAGELYGIFGGRDSVSDSTRISKAALCAALRRVLDYHASLDRTASGDSRPAPDLTKPRITPRDLPGYASWSAKRINAEKSDCLHCHQVGEIMRQPALDAGTFDKQRDLQIWPLPENVGVALDRDDGLLVTSVKTKSPAALAGLQPGDVLKSADGRPLFGQADFRGVLHRGPQSDGQISLAWMRQSEMMSAELVVKDGWRMTSLDWRMSVSQGNIGAGPGFFPLLVNEGRRKALGIPADVMAVKPYMGREPSQSAFAGQGAYEAGLRPQHVITAVDDRSPDIWGRSFLTWFRLRYDSGDRVTYSIIDSDGRRREILVTLR